MFKSSISSKLFASLLAIILIFSFVTAFRTTHAEGTSPITADMTSQVKATGSLDGNMDTFIDLFGNGSTQYYLTSDVASLKLYFSTGGGPAKYSFAFYTKFGETPMNASTGVVYGKTPTEVKVDVPQGATYFSVWSLSSENVSYYYNLHVNEVIVDKLIEPSPTATPSPTLMPAPSSTPDPTPSATPIATPVIPSGDRAILTITTTTGMVKEFDLSMTEVNAFLNWYDTENGSVRYGINKHENNKGPFNKRTEYVVHDKILTFEVSEYSAQ